MTGAPAILGIVGPTASGKSDLALALARRVPIEIVVADSRQVYRGMNVGTAKPTPADRAEVPHHLLDLVDPDEAFTVAHWVERARIVVNGIADRGRRPLLVGGSGLYVSALLDGHDYAGQAWAPEVRERLADDLESAGLSPLVGRLRGVDPAAAARIDLRNPRRVLRALERAEAGGRGAVPRATPYAGVVALVALELPRAILYRRIDERARWMFERGGLLDEVRRLLEAGFGPDLRPMTGHGYREAAAHLAGTSSLEEAIDVTARRTRQYAKRQLSWFRRDPRVRWIAAADRSTADIAAEADAALAPAFS